MYILEESICCISDVCGANYQKNSSLKTHFLRACAVVSLVWSEYDRWYISIPSHNIACVGTIHKNIVDVPQLYRP